jgi:hypothetical protein
MGQHIAIRVAQLDWLPTNFSPLNVTVASGIFPNFNTSNWQQNFQSPSDSEVAAGTDNSVRIQEKLHNEMVKESKCVRAA